MFVVYILYSEKLKKYYAGSTENFERRITEHNSGKANFTSKGIPWKLIKIIDCENRSIAISLEKQIKSRGIKRYLEENFG